MKNIDLNKPITQVTQSDVGRIAVTPDGELRVKLLSTQPSAAGYSHVEYVEGTKYDPRLVGKASFDFCLISHSSPMYWESEVEKLEEKKCIKIIKTQGLGCFKDVTLDKNYQLLSLEYEGDQYIRFYDDINDLVALPLEWENSNFIFVDPEEEKFSENTGSKPRFHKKRKKPPVRKKTDIIIKYKDGDSYTLKGVSQLRVGLNHIEIDFHPNQVVEGITKFSSVTLDKSIVSALVVKSKQEVYNMSFGLNTCFYNDSNKNLVFTVFNQTFTNK